MTRRSARTAKRRGPLPPGGLRRRLVIAFVLVAAVSAGILAVASYVLVRQARLQGSLTASAVQAREDLNLAATITYPVAASFSGWMPLADPTWSWLAGCRNRPVNSTCSSPSAISSTT